MMGLIREVAQVLRKKWADLRGLYARGGGGGGAYGRRNTVFMSDTTISFFLLQIKDTFQHY